MNWKDKIQPGYIYQIGTIPFLAITGSEGAISFGHLLQSKGVPDAAIQQSIGITEDDNLYTTTVFTPLANVEWKETDEQKIKS